MSSWDFPGANHNNHNNQPSPGFNFPSPGSGGYPPPGGPPPQPFGFPSPGGPQPPWQGPGGPGGYAPPPGPPGAGFPSYPPPNGPPPHGFPSPAGHSPHGFPSPAAPPPSGYPPPGGPPPRSGQGYPPPNGPPPPGTPGYGFPSPPGGGGYQSSWNQQPLQGYSQQPYGALSPPAGGQPHMPPTQVQHYGPQMGGQQQQQQQPWFQYSQCTGKKKALCIGINYFKQSGELRGCINDANNVQKFLCRTFNYKTEDIVMLTDDQRDTRKIPTRANILAAMQWLVKGAQPNDSLFFHYSGHGGQTKDLDGDEGDGQDEVIYPVDFEKAGHIVDDEMHAIMVRSLPAGCRLTAIFDSCHSGSALDLPYIYSTEGKVKEPNLAAEVGKTALGAVTAYARGDMGGLVKGLGGLIKSATGGEQKAAEYAKKTRTSSADVISWSGCKDSQTSADAVEAGSATGAMSFAFIDSMGRNSQQTYQQLLVSIRQILSSKYSQKPQLSASHPMDTSILFVC